MWSMAGSWKGGNQLHMEVGDVANGRNVDVVRRLLPFAAGLTAVGLLLLYIGCVNSAENLHRQIDGMRVAELRLTLWDYHVDHKHPPARLSEIIPQAGRANSLRFGTLQRLSCYLRYWPDDAKRGKRAAYVKYGDPPLVEYELAANGMIIREHRRPHLRWRAAFQKRVDYPELRFNRFNDKRIPPPDFHKVVDPWGK